MKAPNIAPLIFGIANLVDLCILQGRTRRARTKYRFLFAVSRLVLARGDKYL